MKNKKSSRLTIEQFNQYKSDGLGLTEMQKLSNASRHHIQFLSCLDQGNFNHITEELFRTDYLSGMALVEIAKKHAISKEHIGFLREHFGINRLGAKFINRKQTEKPLTPRQKELIYGSLMGDCTKMSPSSIKMKHSVKQREYLLWKFSELEEHSSRNSLQEEEYYDKRYNCKYTNLRFYTNANTDIESIINVIYPEGKKIVTQEALDELTAFSVAVWFMDDGTTDKKERQILIGHNAKPSSHLCTDSFSLNEVEMVCSWFSEKWNIKCLPKLRRELQYRVFFPVTQAPKLFDLIRPHIIPSMMYKIKGFSE